MEIKEFPFHRIAILGTTGSSKTTLANELGGLEEIPVISLDNLKKDGNGNTIDTESFLHRLESIVSDNSWIIDGGYKMTHPTILRNAQAAMWQAALELAELTGDVSLQARCLAYLAVTYRRQNHTVETEAYARRGLTVAEAAKMLEYVGANQANLAWVAWRRADPSQAERLAQVALESWRVFPMAYPFYWQALLPLLSIALHINSLDRQLNSHSGSSIHSSRKCRTQSSLLSNRPSRPGRQKMRL